MTRKSKSVRPLLALAAALVAAPLAADEPTVVTGKHQPVYQEQVSFGDLDLRKGSAQRALRQRVKSASIRVCQQAEGMLHDTPSFQAGHSCDEQTYDDARPQIRVAIDNARAGQHHTAMTFVISATRVR